MAEPENTDPFKIDEHHLDREWITQAQFARRAGRAEADARHEHAQAKTRLDMCAAGLLLDIRRNPEKYGIAGKPTEAMVDATVILQPEHIQLTSALHAAKRMLDYRTADTTACVDRRKALERLVELLSISYYAEAEPRAATPVAREKMDARRRRSIREDSDNDG